VKRAVVVPVEKGPDQKQLVAYVVPSADEGFSPAEARIKLSAILPDYMLPQRFVVLDELPRTVSGKIDRSALSKLEQMHEELHVPSGGANNALEWGLQQIWEELLNVRPVGVWDDFFELGGHSLLAIRMMDKVEQTIGVRCQASALLRTPTIKGLAQAILEDRLSHLTSPLIHLRSEGHKTPFYYLHGDYSGGGLYCMNIVKHLESDRPFIVIPSHGLSEEPPTTIEEMAADRLQVILAHQKEGPFLLGGYCHGGLIAFEMARQMEQRGLKVDLLLLVDSVGERVPHRIIQGLFRLYGAMHGLSKQDCQALGIRALVELVQLEREGRWPSLRNTRGLLERVNAIKKRVRWLKRILRHLRKEGLSLPAFPDAPSRTSIAYREGYLRSIYKRAVRGYEAHSYTGKVIVLRSSATDERFPGDPTIGWGKVAGTVEPRLIPGDHMTCLTEHVVVLAKTIDEFLRKTDEPSLSQ
jgi:thioesterase domain-containing protein/acyl carrier protein